MGRKVEVDVTRIDVHTDDPRGVVVAVSGEVDISIHDKLLDTVQSAVKIADVEDVRKVVVDLSHTSFLDSVGIRVLIQGRKAADLLGIEYLVTGATGLVHRVLDITGVLTYLTDRQPPDLQDGISSPASAAPATAPLTKDNGP
jgi:anti-sigma B factor antagonist